MPSWREEGYDVSSCWTYPSSDHASHRTPHQLPPGSPCGSSSAAACRSISTRAHVHSKLQSCWSCRGGCDGSKATGANLMAGSLGWLHILPRGRWHGDMRQVGTGTMLQRLCGPSLGKPKDTAAPGTLGERSLPELGSPHPAPAVLGAEGISSGMVLTPIPQKTERTWAGPVFWVEEGKCKLSDGWKFLSGCPWHLPTCQQPQRRGTACASQLMACEI